MVALITVLLADLVANAAGTAGIDLTLAATANGCLLFTFAFGLINLTGRALPPGPCSFGHRSFWLFHLFIDSPHCPAGAGGGAIRAAQLLGATGRELFDGRAVIKACVGSALRGSLVVGRSLRRPGLGQGKLVTLSVAVYRLIGHYHFPLATALGTVFILLSPYSLA